MSLSVTKKKKQSWELEKMNLSIASPSRVHMRQSKWVYNKDGFTENEHGCAFSHKVYLYVHTQLYMISGEKSSYAF